MLSFAGTPEQSQHDVGWCYVITIMRRNIYTSLARLVESTVLAFASSTGQTHVGRARGTGFHPRYGMAS